MSSPSTRRRKSAPPPPKGIVWAAEKWKNIAWAFGAIVLIGATYSAIKLMAPAVEPFVPSHRQYSRDVAAEAVAPVAGPNKALIEWKLESAVSSATTNADGWSVQLSKEKDPDQKKRIQEIIDKSRSEASVNSRRLESLRSGQKQQH